MSRRDMAFDRTVSGELMDLLTTGAAGQLLEVVRQQDPDAPLLDVQLRRDPKGSNPRSWATLYYGMTALLNIEERRGQFRLTAHARYRAAEAFDDGWCRWQRREQIEAVWPEVEVYLDEVRELVAASHLGKEGPVHAAISSGASDPFGVINREARPSFHDTPTRDRRLDGWVAPFNRRLAARTDAPGWWPNDVRVGSSLDFLAVDIGGRLALVEAKSHRAQAGELAKVAVQAGVYAAMFADLLHEQPETHDAIERMLAQRTALGLSRPGVLHLRDKGQVVPVVAIGPERPSDEVQRRMWEVAQEVANEPSERVDPLEVWYLDETGRIREVERAADIQARRRR